MISREQAIATLKKTWRTEELKFYAEFFRPKKDGALIKPRPGVNPIGFFRNLSINDRKIFYPSDEVLKYERNIFFKVDVVKGLEDGKYYYLELELEDEENRKENPYALKIKEVYILEEDHLSPKDFINQWFYKKGHTPGDASTIAGQLTLNELELYTHTKRFIFELIQNADDMPDGSRDVNIEINLLPNHLLFLHNGKYFDREDVKAISDAAKSTKSKSLSQTGYKGIGFKSVFTDSIRVYIKSGDYFFKFDKLEPIYKDFYRLYKGYLDNLTPKARKEFEIDYKGREKEYTLIDKIPWQIKPIWVEPGTVPQELSSSPFFKNRQVSIALEISENILRQKDYHGMILGLLREPRFLLFLRNTKSFRYSNIADQNSDSIIDISVKEKNDIIGVYRSEELIASYIKHAFTISITNEDFTKAGLNFQKREVEGGKIEFFDNNGNKLDNISEKLGRLDRTIITLSAKMDKYAIEKLDKEDSILFNYLPTSDQRFGFPFLVNADFVSKTDREFIQIENKWNHYIFYHLGQKCIEWIAILAKVTHEFQGKKLFSYAKTYLNLLPDELLDEDNEELSSINIAFNKGLTDAIQSSSFIIDNNGNTKKCDEIILDDTLISSVLGNGFFKEFTKTKKELPFFIFDVENLKKGYLNIERYEAETLITEFSAEANKLLLTKTLTRLKPEKYFDFLAWLDTFCNINDVDNDWLLDLPIIRINESVISLKESLVKSDFYFRVSRTKELEPVLNKIGFTLSELNIDDDNFKHLRAVILQQESYLKTDLKLYEHIAAAKDLSKLTATEKNTLITFFQSLDEVSKAKYAKSLALFKSKKVGGSIKPLNSLISNSCVGLPRWLNDFVIDAEEENALSISFKSMLLKEKDLLEKLFCNSETYSEIITGINTDNVEEFYEYLLKLHEGKTDDFDIDKTIPWIFIETGLPFAKDSDVYLPDSFTKLPKTKYASVKTVIESISNEKLPHFSALQIKVPFALGGNKFRLTEIIPKGNLLEVITVNDFLDWAEANGEPDLLNNFSFTKVGDKFSIGRVGGTVAYYTTDLGLIQLFEASTLHSKLTLFPSELYTKERSKIGLLEVVSLLKYLIENGLATPALAKYIQGANDTQLSLQYLELLIELNIDSTKSYTIEDAEFKILKLVTGQIIDDSEKLDSFREKITLDGIKLLEKAVSADVRMFDAENKFIYQFLNIELSDILPGYKGKTYPVSEIIELFADFRDSDGLKKIFRAKGKSTKKIYKELLDLKLEVYDAAQTFFLSYYQLLYPEELVLKDKLFLAVDPETNRDAFEKEVGKFLDYCVLEDNYFGFVKQGIIDSFNPNNLIINDDYATELERLPYWLKTWLTGEHDEKKKLFIEKIKINGEDSHVVQLRKGLSGDTSVNMDAARGGITKPELLKNTFEWLMEKHPSLVYNSTTLKPLYERANVLNIPISEIPLPLPLNIEGYSYTLHKPSEAAEFHLIWNGWGNFKKEIWEFLKNKNCLILDNILPEKYLEKLDPLKSEGETKINSVELKNGLRDFNAWFYKHWEGKDNCIIKIYRGDKLPQLVVYNNQTIKTFNDGLSKKIDGEYIVAESIETSIPHSIKDLIPEFFHELNSWKSDFENNRTERKLTPQEEEAIMKLFDGVVPEELRKNQNLSALASALIYLEEKGYDVYQANKALINTHEYAQLAPVYKNGEEYTIMCRSARLGLLYLTKQAWDRLNQPDVMLFADRGYDDPKLFKTKQEVLDVNIDNPTDFQLMRIESRANAQDLDQMLQGNFEDASRLWIILRLKGNEHFDKLFFERPETNNTTFNTAKVKSDDDGGY